MIPDKLYIPTSTLNFNNIMSSESISPAGFYSVRGFGYKRFEKTEPNNLDNCIVLYENYPIFNINDEKLENYPMIIEIDKKDTKEDIIQEHKKGVFYTEETVYFNPISTKIYFRTESEKRSTLSKAEPSIESKMIALYQNCFEIQPENIKNFDIEKLDIEDKKNDIFKHIAQDKRINKLKGFLYAYILAANKSFPVEVVTLKKCTKDLRNTLSAVIATSDGQPTYKQKESLNSIYRAINDTFFKAEGLDKKLQKISEEFFKEGKFEEFIASFGNAWLPKPTFQLSPFFTSGNANADEKEKALEQYISNLEKAINRFTNPKLIQKEQFPILQHCYRIESIPEQKEFLTKLLNEYLEEAYNSEDFIQSRYEFAKSGGKIFKEQIQKDWDGSEYQMYINTLLRNLNEYSQFEINSTDNLTLKSFAAFCQKGESDIDKLEDYLISNKIGDFRIAFALWGVVFGFANLPKTLTNNLFLCNDKYVEDVYKYIFKQVHNIDLIGNFERKQEEKEFVSISSKMNEQTTKNKIPEISKTVSLEQELSEFEEFISRDKTTKTEIIKKLNEQGIYSLSDWSSKKVDVIKWSTSKGQKKLVSVVTKSKQNNSSKQFETTIFGQMPVGSDFCKDETIFEHLKSLLPSDKKTQKQFKDDLDWFQGNYQEFYDDKNKGRQKGYYFDKPKDNNSVIENFNKYLTNKKRQGDEKANMKWLRDIYSQIDSDKIISKLKELYS